MGPNEEWPGGDVDARKYFGRMGEGFPKILLAYGVNDTPLPQKHGFPLRLVLEDHYGYEWVKYVDEIVVS